VPDELDEGSSTPVLVDASVAALSAVAVLAVLAVVAVLESPEVVAVLVVGSAVACEPEPVVSVVDELLVEPAEVPSTGVEHATRRKQAGNCLYIGTRDCLRSARERQAGAAAGIQRTLNNAPMIGVARAPAYATPDCRPSPPSAIARGRNLG
jgi:hypothetical protein